MKINYKKDIKNNEYSIVVFCEELGTSTVDAETEAIQIENFSPRFEYKDLTWNGKFKVGADGNVVEDTESGDSISIGLINKVINVDENLSVEFRIKTSQVKKEQYESNTSIINANLYCDACCMLFRKVIKEAVATSLANMRSKINEFEDVEDGDII